MSRSQETAPFAGSTIQQLHDLHTYVYYGPDPDQVLRYPIYALDKFLHYQCITSIHSAVRIASAFVLCLLLFLVSQRYKSLLFILYQTNFLLMMVGGALELAWVMSYNGSITQFMTATSPNTIGYNVSMAASVVQTVLILNLLATLVVQIYVSFSDQRRQYQLGVTGLAMLGCFPAYFICIWRLAIVGISLYSPSSQASDGFGLVFFASDTISGGKDIWAVLNAWRAFSASCAFCSIILCIKLYYVSRNRAKMGLVKFDALRILFTMALQNSVIPSVLAIVSSAISIDNEGGKSVAASAIPVCACMLPMGFIWAQYKTTHPTAPVMTLHQQKHQFGKDELVRDNDSEHSVSGKFLESPMEKKDLHSVSSVRISP